MLFSALTLRISNICAIRPRLSAPSAAAGERVAGLPRCTNARDSDGPPRKCAFRYAPRAIDFAASAQHKATGHRPAGAAPLRAGRRPGDRRRPKTGRAGRRTLSTFARALDKVDAKIAPRQTKFKNAGLPQRCWAATCPGWRISPRCRPPPLASSPAPNTRLHTLRAERSKRSLLVSRRPSSFLRPSSSFCSVLRLRPQPPPQQRAGHRAAAGADYAIRPCKEPLSPGSGPPPRALGPPRLSPLRHRARSLPRGAAARLVRGEGRFVSG